MCVCLGGVIPSTGGAPDWTFDYGHNNSCMHDFQALDSVSTSGMYTNVYLYIYTSIYKKKNIYIYI